jgi:hypothetical protein
MMSADIISIGSRERIKAAPSAVSNVEHTNKAGGGTRHTSPPPMTGAEFAQSYELLPLEEREAISADLRSRHPSGTDGQTATRKNQRLRDQRRVIWERAEAATGYWDARERMNLAVRHAQNREAPEGALHPAWKLEDHKMLYAKRNEAKLKQLLTPAHHLASVKWKQHELARWPSAYADHKKKIEKLIAADLAFLAAHPLRRDRGSKRP